MSGNTSRANTIETPAHRGRKQRTGEPVPIFGSGLISRVHTRVHGRVRFSVATLYRSERVKHRLERGLRQIAGIKSVQANVLTGKLLVVFAQEKSADEIAVLVLRVSAIIRPQYAIYIKKYDLASIH